MSQAHLFRPLAARSQKDLWRGAMGVFLQKVVFHFPNILNPQAVGQFNLV